MIYWYVKNAIQEDSFRKKYFRILFREKFAFLKLANFNRIALKNKIAAILKQCLENSIKKKATTTGI